MMMCVAGLTEELVACRCVGSLALVAWIHSSAWAVVITTHFLQSPDANNMCEKSMLSQRVLQAMGLRAERRSVAPAWVN